MNLIATILQKVLAREFYRTNASLFLIVLGLGVGFMKGEDHVVLAEMIVTSPFLTIIPFVVWVVYSAVIIDFNQRTIRRQEHEFMYHFILFPRQRQWALVSGVVFAQFLPAIAYGIFLVLIGIRFQMWISIALLLTCLISVFTLVVFFLRHTLLHPGVEDKISELSRHITRNLTRPYFTFALEGLIRKQPLMVIASKAAGVLLLWASLALYNTDAYDIRLLGIGIALGVSLNAGVISEWHYFDNVSFSLMRALPITMLRRCTLFLTALILYMPAEAGLLLTKFPAALSGGEQLSAIIFLMSIPFLAYSFLFTRWGAPKKYTNYHFFITLSWVLLILSGVPLWSLGLLNFGVGALCWKKSYYHYEYLVERDLP